MPNRVNALITVKSQSVFEGNTDDIEMLVGGHFSSTDSGYEIIYDETDPETSEVTHTTITIVLGGQITVKREGGVNTQMIFERRRRHLVYYDTQFGSLLVGVTTHRIDMTLEPDTGGTLEVDYALEIDGQIANEIRLSLKVAPSVEKEG